MKTFKNKLYAVGLMLCGSVPTFLEQDATALVCIGMIAVPLFLSLIHISEPTRPY